MCGNINGLRSFYSDLSRLLAGIVKVYGETLTVHFKCLKTLAFFVFCIDKAGLREVAAKSLILKGNMASLGAAFVSPLTGVGGTRKRRRLSHWEPTSIEAVQSAWEAV